MLENNNTKQLIEYGQQHLFPTYRQPALVMVRGEGPFLFDAEGNRYIDLTGGISVTSLGHCHPEITAAITQQAGRLSHVSNLFYNDKANLLAEQLCAKTGFADRVFFCNSGAEANEAAIKAARRYFYDRKESRFEVISAFNSFHGRTLATVTATGQPKYHEGFAPLPAGFKHVPYGDIQALSAAMTKNTALVMLEPIQGEGGVVIPPAHYLKQVRDLCSAQGVLLHFDEVQVGMGRTGRWFCYQHEGVLPDSVSLAKAIAGGLPMGAFLAKEDLARVLVPGTHASTFGGNPVACAAALAYMRVVEQEQLLERAVQIELRALALIRQKLKSYVGFKDARAKGCLIGIELDAPVRPLLQVAREHHVLATVSADNVLRLAPPFNIPFDILDQGLSVLCDVILKTPLSRA